MNKQTRERLLNQKAMEYFNTLDSAHKEKFILQRVRRTKAFKQYINPLQKETSFAFDDLSQEYIYPYANNAAYKHKDMKPSNNVFLGLQRIMQDVESKFKANNLHFSIYGTMHKYKKQILQAKNTRDTLKHNHFKGLDNLKNAITNTHLAVKEQVRIENLYEKMLHQYHLNVA